MSLKDQLREDLHQAMRERDERGKAALRLMFTAVQTEEATQQKDLSDAEVVVLIRKEVKRREEALELARRAGREDMVAVDEAELEILRAYLPQLLSAEAVRPMAQKVIEELGASSPADLGRVMGALMPQLKGKADGRMVNQLVRELLSA